MRKNSSRWRLPGTMLRSAQHCRMTSSRCCTRLWSIGSRRLPPRQRPLLVSALRDSLARKRSGRTGQRLPAAGQTAAGSSLPRRAHTLSQHRLQQRCSERCAIDAQHAQRQYNLTVVAKAATTTGNCKANLSDGSIDGRGAEAQEEASDERFRCGRQPRLRQLESSPDRRSSSARSPDVPASARS